MRVALAVLAAFHSANPASSHENADTTSLSSGSDKNRAGTSTFPLLRGWHCCGGVTQPTKYIGFNHFNNFPPLFKACGDLALFVCWCKSCFRDAARLSPACWPQAGMLPSAETSVLPRAAGASPASPCPRPSPGQHLRLLCRALGQRERRNSGVRAARGAFQL